MADAPIPTRNRKPARGRPTVTFRSDPAVLAAMYARAGRDGVPPVEVIRRALAAYLAEETAA